MRRALTLILALLAVDAAAAAPTAFFNVNVIPMTDERVLPAQTVMVEDGVITAVSEDAISPPAGATVIDGGNRVLSPGFIDLHVHLTSHVPSKLGNAHSTAVGAIANDVARHFLDSGFTSIRDAGGTHPDLARAIEEGIVYGPRVFPSGAILSQTGGHGDWRHADTPHPTLESGSPYMGADQGVLVDGVDLSEVDEQRRKPNPMKGADGIKRIGFVETHLRLSLF